MSKPLRLNSSVTALCRRPVLHRGFASFQSTFKPARQPSLLEATRLPASFLPTVTMRHCCHHRYLRREEVESASSVSGGREVLPADVKPLHYDLTLEPDLEKCTYHGQVAVDLLVQEKTSSIVLNTIDLEIQSASVTKDSQVIESSPKISTDTKLQTTTFAFNTTFSKGDKVTIDIKFTGFLNDALAGFYRSSYVSKDGSKKYLATTQMEATDARRAFPCWDEPALKATFAVTLLADKGLTCLSNMDVKKEEEVVSSLSGLKKQSVAFNTTPLVSTYLLAFIIGEFNYVESLDFRVPIRVYAPIDQDIELGRFSLDIAAKVLPFYEKAFANEFPLPKMDMVAIPDFSAGAMENWGLITYRTVDVLFDPKVSGQSTRQRVAEVVAHELAHQWFGNLVTMDFWEGLWLNEGFATWMSWFSLNHFYPEWKIWQSFVTDDLQSALGLDSLRSSHPIEVPVKRADEINQIFDAISYSKGSCVLRMISKFLGEETFLQGVKDYIKKHAYGNTKTTDLWAALSAASGKDVEKAMTIWTKYVGYPVVTVTENEKDSSIHVKQNRFLRTADVTPEEDKTLYPVFLGLRTKDGVDEELALTAREGDYKVPSLDFFKLNADHTSLYRTFYSSERLTKLGEQAKTGLLSVEDRAGMVSDASALSASGYQPSSGTLALLKGFASEKDYTVWEQVLSGLGSLRNAWLFEPQATRDALKKFQLDLTGQKAEELGWEFKESDDGPTQQFKSLMFGSAGLAGDQKIVAAAKELFAKFAKGDRSAIHPNIRASVYAIALTNDGAEEAYDVILNEWRTAKTSDERNSALRSIGRAKSPNLIERTLALAFGDEVRAQDIYMPMGGLRTHPEGVSALWAGLVANWDKVVKRVPQGSTLLLGVVQSCSSGFTKPAQREEVEKFFKGRDTTGFDQGLAQSLDAIRAKSAWVARDAGDVDAWLKGEGYY